MSSTVGIRSRALMTAATAALCVALAGCATPQAGGTPTVTDSPTPSETAAPTPIPTPSPTSSSPVPTAPADPAADVSVVIITLDIVAGTVEASGMVTQLVEEGGTCVLTLTMGDLVQTVEGSTSPGQESTYCALLTLPTTGLASGAWQATLAYRSAAHYGISGAEELNVP